VRSKKGDVVLTASNLMSVI